MLDTLEILLCGFILSIIKTVTKIGDSSYSVTLLHFRTVVYSQACLL